MAMRILVAGCLYHPDQTIGVTNGSCPLVFCLQKSCRGFEFSYTVVLGSITDSDTDRK